MRTLIALLVAASCALIPFAGQAGEPLRGSPDFVPSPEHPVGWRGDGSGRFPGAEPPQHWGRVAKSLKPLRAQAAKPKEGDTGQPISDGSIREWLILGPVPVPDELKKLDKDVLPDEAKLEPEEGQKAGDLVWKKISSESQTLNFRALFGVEKVTQAVAYACAYVHCDDAQRFHLNVMSSGYRLLVNGLPPKDELSLQKGWNRLLFRVQPAALAEYASGPEPLWYLRGMLYGASGSECETENISWCTRLPGWGISTPLIVGDKIFATVGQRSLCCLSKNDGQVLWMRTISLYDVATEEEKKAKPDVFLELAPLAAKLAELDRSIKPGVAVPADLPGSKSNIEDSILKLMSKVDREKYALYPVGEGGVSAQTPASDGQNIYVTFLPYLIACFDLEGNRQWIHMHAWNPPYAGAESHGMYNSPVLLDGKLLIHSDRLFALDPKTGNVLWQNANTTAANPVTAASLLALTIDKEPLVVVPCNIFRARDGKTLSTFKGHSYYGCIGTPIIAEGKIFRLFMRWDAPGTTMLDMIRLPSSPAEPFNAELLKGVLIDANRFPRWYGGWTCASPLYHEGLVYCLSEDGVLSVVDVEKQAVLYQKLLDLDLEMQHINWPSRGGACASPALAGKSIYLFGDRGTCIVMEPGRTFRPVARNRVENTHVIAPPWCGYPEQTASCPVFEGKRLYYRALENLYCIEEKK